MFLLRGSAHYIFSRPKFQAYSSLCTCNRKNLGEKLSIFIEEYNDVM